MQVQVGKRACVCVCMCVCVPTHGCVCMYISPSGQVSDSRYSTGGREHGNEVGKRGTATVVSEKDCWVGCLETMSL